MSDEIEKSEPSPDDVLVAIQSFNDPSIITNLFRDLGWTYSVEIKETVTLAQQNANMSIKFKAIKYLRELLREAAEAAGYVANISSTAPNAHGGHTTFSAKRISGILNPVKKIESTEIKESQNDKTEETRTESNRGSDRRKSKRPEGTGEVHEGISSGTDTGLQFPPDSERGVGGANNSGDGDSGGVESPDRGEASGTVAGGLNEGELRPKTSAGDDSDSQESNPSINRDSTSESPCIKTRPPTCDQDLFPGISSAEE